MHAHKPTLLCNSLFARLFFCCLFRRLQHRFAVQSCSDIVSGFYIKISIIHENQFAFSLHKIVQFEAQRNAHSTRTAQKQTHFLARIFRNPELCQADSLQYFHMYFFRCLLFSHRPLFQLQS